MGVKAIVVENLEKRYKTYLRIGFRREKSIIHALRGISFSTEKGEVFGLLGPNGAGKTTLVKILSTLLLPDSGRASVLDYDVVREPEEVRRRIGVSLSVERGFFWKLTGRENLRYFGMLYGLDGRKLRERVNLTLKLVGLDELGASDKLYEEYSTGMKARLSIARALLTDPEVLILDEPTLGLDPNSARLVRELLLDLAHREGKTVLVTTHNMFEAEMMCDRVAIINKGEIIALDYPENLKKLLEEGNLTIELLIFPPAKLSIAELEVELSEIASVEVSPETVGVRVRVSSKPDEREALTQALLSKLHSLGCGVRRVEVKEPTLEDVFVELTRGKGR
ncbi:MAG: ABC transporter ATP-binding protein [Candidatus Korarchaeum sp.]|nr:ABC transporter ATP-binding protein [Candidatus Korarchaeum sp.]MDW8035088.1 ABC transporter ATP-binding protein [Candidatus Korarchaeum sp.]